MINLSSWPLGQDDQPAPRLRPGKQDGEAEHGLAGLLSIIGWIHE